MLLAFSNLAADMVEELKGMIRDAGKIKSVKMLCEGGELRLLEDSCFKETGEGEYSFHIVSKLEIHDIDLSKCPRRIAHKTRKECA